MLNVTLVKLFFFSQTVSRVEAPRTLPSPDKFFNCSIIFRLPSLVGDYDYRIELAVNNWTNAFPLKIGEFHQGHIQETGEALSKKKK